MALKATVFKAQLRIADSDRGYYRSHSLTLARHPSETDERMMMRLLAFCLFAHERLVFGKGLSTDEEPDLWQHGLSGEIELWVEVGQPVERRLRRACGRAREVAVLGYGGRTADLWWRQNAEGLSRLPNLRVLDLPGYQSQALAALARRSMDLQCTISGGTIWIGDGTADVELAPSIRQG